MDLAAKKLAFIKEYLHISNEKIVDRLASVLQKEKKKTPSKKHLSDFFGIMTKKEGEEFMQNIKEGCEKIDSNEW